MRFWSGFMLVVSLLHFRLTNGLVELSCETEDCRKDFVDCLERSRNLGIQVIDCERLDWNVTELNKRDDLFKAYGKSLRTLRIRDATLLGGNLPKGLRFLTKLRELEILRSDRPEAGAPKCADQGNWTFPVWLSSTGFPKLQQVHLYGLEFAGTIPEEFFSPSWPFLTEVRLSQIAADFPAKTIELHNWETVELCPDWNQTESLIKVGTGVRNLKLCRFPNVHGLTDDEGNVTREHLETLELHQVSNVDMVNLLLAGSWSRLMRLRLSQVTGSIPSQLQLMNDRFPWLTDLEISGHPFVDEIDGLDSFSNLEFLNISGNNIGKITLQSMSNLTLLDLSNNPLGSDFDLSIIAGFPVLETFWMANAQLEGSIPWDSFPLGMKDLELSYNRLNGMLEGLPPLLTSLSLRENLLTGTIDELAKLKNLKHLALNMNQLSGTLDPISLLGNLRTVDLSANRLSGPIPESWVAHDLIHTLNLYDNKIDGVIPENLATMRNLRYLLLARNRLTGISSGFLEKIEHYNAWNDSFDSECLKGWAVKKHITLGNNQYQCDCNLLNEFSNSRLNPRLYFYNHDRSAVRDMGLTSCTNANHEWGGQSLLTLQTDPEAPCSSVRSLQTGTVEANRFSIGFLEQVPPDSTLEKRTEFDGLLLDFEGNAISRREDGCFECVRNIQSFDWLPRGSLVWGFEVEYAKVTGDVIYDQRNLCCIYNSTVVDPAVGFHQTFLEELTPFTLYTVKVRPFHLYFDNIVFDVRARYQLVYHSSIYYGPYLGGLQVKTGQAPPGSPQDVRLIFAHERSVSVGWNPPAIPNGVIRHYEIFVDGKFVEMGNSHAIILNRLNANTNYSIQVRAVNELGQTGNFSDPVLVQTKDACPEGYVRTENPYGCVPCDLNSYRGSMEAACVTCPADLPLTFQDGSTSDRDCFCGANCFVMEHPQTKRRSAQSCSESPFAGKVDCSERKGLTLQSLPLLPGFWRIGPNSTDILRCFPREFCVPGNLSSTNRTMMSDIYCSNFHTGILCLQCEDGYAMKSGGCAYCNEEVRGRDKGIVAFWVILLVSCTLAPSIYFVYLGFCVDLHGGQTPPSCCGCCPRITHHPNGPVSVWNAFVMAMGHSSVRLRILIGFFQVYFGHLRASNSLEVVGSLVAIVTTMDFGTLLAIMYPSCYLKEEYGVESTLPIRIVTYTVFPLAVIGISHLTMLCFKFWGKPENYKLIKYYAVWVLLVTCYLIYPTASSLLISVMTPLPLPHFPDDPNPFEVMASSEIHEFKSSFAKTWRLYAWVMIPVFVVGIPVLFYALIYRNRGKPNGHGYSPSRAALDFLCIPYKNYAQWFETYELIRKLLQIQIFALMMRLSKDYAAQTFLILVFLSHYILLKLQPYVVMYDMQMAEFSTLLLYILALFTIYQVETFWPYALLGFTAVGFFIIFLGLDTCKVYKKRQQHGSSHPHHPNAGRANSTGGVTGTNSNFVPPISSSGNNLLNSISSSNSSNNNISLNLGNGSPSVIISQS